MAFFRTIVPLLIDWLIDSYLKQQRWQIDAIMLNSNSSNGNQATHCWNGGPTLWTSKSKKLTARREIFCTIYLFCLTRLLPIIWSDYRDHVMSVCITVLKPRGNKMIISTPCWNWLDIRNSLCSAGGDMLFSLRKMNRCSLNAHDIRFMIAHTYSKRQGELSKVPLRISGEWRGSGAEARCNSTPLQSPGRLL